MQTSMDGLNLVGCSFSRVQIKEIEPIEALIRQGEIEKAFDKLCEYLKEAENIKAHEEIYQYMFQIIPYLESNKIQTLLQHLTEFFDSTASLVDLQYRLAIILGDRYDQLSEQKKAVHCYGKAIKISELIHHQSYLLQAHLKASRIISKNTEERLTEKYFSTLEKYREQLRRSPLVSEVRAFQVNSMNLLKNLFELFLNDASSILGIPPSEFDLRATGSLGREETTLFPSIEFFLLIESIENEKYFNELLTLIELQILSLGETPDDFFKVTCLRGMYDKGFRLDPKGNPLKVHLLFGTPQLVASIQMSYLNQFEEPQSNPVNKVLKSVSLLRNRKLEISSNFMKNTNVLLDTGKEIKLRNVRVNDQLNFELSKFKKEWFRSDFPPVFDLNERYGRFLTNLLSSMALYWKLEETNSLDTINALVENGNFTKKSGELLTTALSFLYLLRNNLQDFYKKDREEVFFDGNTGYVLKNEEKKELESIYWLVLYPLYHICLSSIFENGKNIEEVLFNVDLFSILVENISSEEEDLCQFFPLMRILGSYPTVFSDHLENIKTLSKCANLDVLKQAYINELLVHVQEEDVLLLQSIPDRTGYRKSNLLRENLFFTQLESISTPDFHRDKKTSQIKIVSSKGFRYIKPEIVREILDDSGNLKNGSVVLNGFLFKQQPPYPLMQYAVYNFWNRFTEDLSPTSECVRFEIDGCEKVYPVLILKNIEGVSLLENYEKLTLFSTEEWRRWTWLLIVSIMTRPGNGLLANFIVDQNKFLRCIDNQISFLEPLSQEYAPSVQFISSLFFLFKERNLDATVLEEFCTLDCDAILRSWIDDVIKKEKDYLSLFSKREIDVFFEEKTFKASLLFPKGTLATLRCQFIYLQNQIAHFLQENKGITPIDLLSFIISINKETILDRRPGQIISQTYQKAHLTQFEVSHRNLSGVANTFDQYEDEALGSLNKAKEELVVKKVTKKSIFISFQELKELNEPDLTRQLKVFNSTAILFDQMESKPTYVTLLDCPILNSSNLHLFLHEKIEYLDISGCQNIKNGDIQIIQRSCPNLKSLKINGCHGVTAIQEGSWRQKPLIFTNLRSLSIYGCTLLKIVSLMSPWKVQVEKIAGYIFDKYEILGGQFINGGDNIQPKSTHLHLVEESCEELISIKSELLEVVNRDGEQLRRGSEQLRDDNEVVLAAISQRGEALRHASKRLQNDRKIVLTAVRDFGTALTFASKDLQEDFEIVITAVQRNGMALQYASAMLKKSKVIIIEAIKQDSWAFNYISPELKFDREFILKVVQINGMILQHLSAEFKKDREIVLAAVKQNQIAFRFAESELRDDEKFRKEANLN